VNNSEKLEEKFDWKKVLRGRMQRLNGGFMVKFKEKLIYMKLF
jgi:hypothetical protein